MYEREKQRELDIADAKRCILGYLPTQEVMMWPKIREDCQNETGVNNNIVSISLSELQEEGKIKRTRCSVDQWNNEHIFYVVQDSESSESGERQGNTEAGLTNKAPAEQSSDANSQPNSLSDEINQYKYKGSDADLQRSNLDEENSMKKGLAERTEQEFMESQPNKEGENFMDICDMYITATILEMPSSVRIEDAMVYSNDDTYKICCMLDKDKEIIEMITCVYRTEESLDFMQCHNFDEFLDFVRTVRFDEDNDDNPSPQDDSSESSE